MSKSQNAYDNFSHDSYQQGRKAEFRRIVLLIDAVIDKHEFADHVGRNKDWQGDPNLDYRLAVAREILFLLTGEK